MSLTAKPHRFERKGVDYVVRPFEEGDRGSFTRLVESTVGYRLAPEWFDATYCSTPYLDHVPIVVAEADGELVGIRPNVPFRVRGGDGETALALFARDSMVHPDHRRRGLFTAMTELLIDRYADSTVAFQVAPSSPAARPASRAAGWRFPYWQETWYRPQASTTFVANRLGPNKRLLAPLAGTALDTYAVVRDRLRRDETLFEVTATTDAPIDTLVAMHARPGGRPSGIHPVFDAPALRYVLDHPAVPRVRTYVATDGDEPIAALAVSARRHHRTNWLSISHIAPLDGDEQWRQALSVLLGRAVADAPDVDAYRVSIPFPESVLAAHGFVSDRHPPMSLLDPPSVKLGLRPFDGNWSLGGESLLGARALWALDR